MKSYQQIKTELGGGARKSPKRFYVFANCPRVIFDDLLATLKEKLGKGTRIAFISSTKESVKEAILSSDFFSSKKIVVFDFELISPTKSQIQELIYTIDKLVGRKDTSPAGERSAVVDDSAQATKLKEKNTERGAPAKLLIIRSERKPIPKEIRDRANSLGVFYWISWKYDDVLSIVKSRFPDVKFMEDAERILKYAISLGMDVEQIMEKAVLYAYPKRYIGRGDIIKVIPPEASLKLKNFSVEVLGGDIKNFPIVERSEDINTVISAFTPYLLAFLKLRLTFSAQRSIKKYLIEKEMKTKDVDGVLKSLRVMKNPDYIASSFSSVLEKSRLGKFPPSFYFFKFAFDIRKKVKG